MKVGTENKKTTVAAIALLGIAALLLFRGFRSSSEESTIGPAPADTQSVSTSLKPASEVDTRHHIGFLLKPTLDPHLRLDLLAQSEGAKYEGSGRDIFTEHLDDTPKPAAPALLAKPDWQPPVPPPPEKIDLKFWGWVNRPGESKAVFLAQGENGFVAHEGDIVARRYKLVKIGPSSIEVEDILGNNRQSISVVF